MGRLSEKVLIVTGAAQGMGEDTAELFIAEGAAHVIVADINVESGQAVAERLGSRASFVRLDVRNAADWEALVSAAMRDHGRIDGGYVQEWRTRMATQGETRRSEGS